MQLSTISEQFSTLLDATRVLNPDAEALAGIETTVRDALRQLYSHRLAAASPTQVQEYFRLLEAFSHNLAGLMPAQRQTLVRQGLRLLREIPFGATDV